MVSASPGRDPGDTRLFSGHPDNHSVTGEGEKQRVRECGAPVAPALPENCIKELTEIAVDSEPLLLFWGGLIHHAVLACNL